MSRMTNLTRPAYSDASSSRTGASLWQWPQRGEKNSTTTGPSKLRTSFPKVLSDIEIGLSGKRREGVSGVLQRPHTALSSPHLAAGMRFLVPHRGQRTINPPETIDQIYWLQGPLSIGSPSPSRPRGPCPALGRPSPSPSQGNMPRSFVAPATRPMPSMSAAVRMSTRSLSAMARTS